MKVSVRLFLIVESNVTIRKIVRFKNSKGLSNQADVELDMINVISAADNTFIMSSSQAIVN